MRAKEFVIEKKKRKKKLRGAAWGPGPYGGYGYAVGYSGDGGASVGGDGGGVGEDQHPNEQPMGPETKPTMPAGTVRVDVDDVYDWYKLGQHISNMKGLGKHDFGKGPPSTIISFGSEEEEHKYIDALKKTGLDTTDIDPVDPNQPKGMKRQKTDPTYNVGENFADGKNPQDKGDSARHGIKKGTSIAQLKKIRSSDSASARKKQLAHWQINMRQGKEK
jgi:hypothetical protein